MVRVEIQVRHELLCLYMPYTLPLGKKENAGKLCLVFRSGHCRHNVFVTCTEV
jgi:hypothetical protein